MFCLSGAAVCHAAGTADDQYVRIYTVVSEADALNASGKTEDALKKYQQAQSQLFELKRANPAWNTKVVNFRLAALAEKIAALSRPAEEPSPTASPSSSSASPATSGSTSGGPVRMLRAGAEPRQILRFSPKPGDAQTVTITIKMGMALQMGPGPGQGMKLPPMQITFDTVVKSVSDDGDIEYETVIKDVTVMDDPDSPPQMVEAIKASMGGIKGLSGAGVYSNRGISKRTELKASTSKDPMVLQAAEQMKDAMSNFATPLPEDPVGVGARWEVRIPIKSQGMTVNQTTIHDLVSMDGDQIGLTSAITQNAANQKIPNPTMPSMTVDVTKMTGKGTGSTTMNLGQILPTAGTGKMHSDITMSMNAGAQRQTMNMKMDMDIRLESK
jgi:hypothetical protein